ncbi:MAG: Tad domain-containing protein [Candidatus Obscuribacterales bacterium]|nr:Tad domain-containing protein [Candidatus Obscuribacterales bacterium]
MNRTPQRNQLGGIVIAVFVTCCLFLALFIFVGQFGVYLAEKKRAQDVVDAAGLAAANEFSRIIINDANFGYVSLSNYPPIGKATFAPDGEPLPVLGINTLIGTIRLGAVVARELNNPTMKYLADNDRSALQLTIEQLNDALEESLTSSHGPSQHDINGEVVDPCDAVTKYLNAHLPADMEVVSVKLSNGWLANGGTTTIPVPKPEKIAQVSFGDSLDGKYKAFVDVAVDENSFSFAGVGPHSTLVNASEFKEPDTEHISSIVKLDCVIGLKKKPLLAYGADMCSKFNCVVCCQPYTQADTSTNGAMTVRFSGGPVRGLEAWSDFLNSSNFQDHQVTAYEIVGGDYPIDWNSRMKPVQSQEPEGTSQQFAANLYYWLRNGHVRAQLDSILSMINEPFKNGPAQVYVYQFADGGAISRNIILGKPFPTGIISDNQVSSVADTSVEGGVSPVIIFRNNVRNLGTQYGGKHCGQPLAGYPLNWQALHEVGNEQALGTRFGLRSSYASGLALDIEIGGTKKEDPYAIRRPPPREI